MKSVLVHDADFALGCLRKALRAEGFEEQARRVEGVQIEDIETARVAKTIVSDMRVEAPKSKLVLKTVNDLLSVMLARPQFAGVAPSPLDI